MLLEFYKPRQVRVRHQTPNHRFELILHDHEIVNDLDHVISPRECLVLESIQASQVLVAPLAFLCVWAVRPVVQPEFPRLTVVYENHLICGCNHDVIQLDVKVDVAIFMEILNTVYQLHTDLDYVSFLHLALMRFPDIEEAGFNILVNEKNGVWECLEFLCSASVPNNTKVFEGCQAFLILPTSVQSYLKLSLRARVILKNLDSHGIFSWDF